ncbi:MAG: carboxylesterase [Gammaproteobacteria bacterium]|nr:carboxylesterase [Gammaproteobacteria bacterium]
MSLRNKSKNIESIETMTGENPEYAIIWLHGLDGDADRFEYAPALMSLPKATRFIFPRGPIRAITSYKGQEMRGWYNSLGEEFGMDKDREGIEETFQMHRSLVARENERGIPTERIFFAGFSQGGAANYFSSLRYPQKLAGIIALSTYLPFLNSTETERTKENQDTPIFVAHGTNDQAIPLEVGQSDRDRLIGMGYQVQWNTYDAAHYVHPDAISDVAKFMASIMQQ